MRKVQSNQLVYQAKLQLARLSFWEYCKLKAPDFYKEGREYLKTFCNTLQDFYYSDKKVLVVNMPPRHGKSRTAQLFVGWVLGKSPSEKIMTGSYNETLSTTFSRGVRNDIQERKADADRVVYKEIFPNNRIKRGDGAANLWSLEGQHANYLATSPSGTATGFGASLLIIDDLIKNAEEANNETVLENHWEWFCFTGNTLVETKNGSKKIKDIVVGDKVLTFNHSKGMIEDREIVRVDSHLDSIYRLEFENGTTIECTGNHKFYTNRGYISIEEILSSMRCSVKEGQTVLFSDLQEQSESRNGFDDNLPELWKENSDGKKEPTNEVLFCGLQTRVSSKTRKGQIHWLGETARQFEGRASEVPTVWSNGESSRAPHRPQHKEQRIGQFGCSMPIVPYQLSQITRLPSSELHRVYDIEVKDNHNFFANGLLVHNCNTMLSRLESGGKVIVIMTRWHSADLAGRVLDHYGKVNPDALVHVNMPTPLPDGSMLCDDVLNREDYEDKARMMGKDVVLANYGQHPIDLQGRLYTHFKTYDDIPREKPVGDAELGEPAFFEIKNYTDTADKGEDYLCSITYGVYHSECYILDVIYTKEPMEVTEPLVAKHLHDYGVQVADIESNNGGRGFGRSVQRIMYEKYHSNRVYFNLFYQSKNKIARILSNATWCMNHIYFPADWQTKYPEFYDALYKYQKEGKNKHDDAPDALTGLAEKVGRGNLYSFS